MLLLGRSTSERSTPAGNEIVPAITNVLSEPAFRCCDAKPAGLDLPEDEIVRYAIAKSAAAVEDWYCKTGNVVTKTAAL